MAKFVGVLTAILSVVLGYGFIQGKIEDPRPFSHPDAAVNPDSKAAEKVEARLWQDPFEAFGTETNAQAAARPDPLGSQNSSPWPDLAGGGAQDQYRAACVGVLLSGGPYAQDKEVRLRLRYAVEVALLTGDMGPEDRTHIFTNSVYLSGQGAEYEPRRSRFAYEWFRNQLGTNLFKLCVLWLNEDDFADQPAERLGSLLGHFFSRTNASGSAPFYLVGPRSSDTLQALAQTRLTNTDDFLTLKTAAALGHFHILSTEATASIRVPGSLESENLCISNDLVRLLGTNIFHPWIAKDQQVARLLAQELTNRLDAARPDSNSVVVVLSEQDTYYGRKLASEWIAAFTNHVCCGASNVWQYPYLCGLDGSKPQSPAHRHEPAPAATPEAALETALTQQREGERADGDAQLDYVIRLADFLQQQDRALRTRPQGGIVAIGVAGSDAYDKLMLLQEFRPRFPGAIFFTTDLDANLWTTKSLRYTRNLLVGSAYSLNPSLQLNRQGSQQQFAPFRDVYQTAVFKACSAIVSTREPDAPGGLDGNEQDLQGGLFILGRQGPVPLTPPGAAPVALRAMLFSWACWSPLYPMLLMALLAFGFILFFLAGSNGGIRQHDIQPPGVYSDSILKAVKAESARQISWRWLTGAAAVILAVGLLAGFVQSLALAISGQPREEPLNLCDGISIWPTEFMRLLALVGAAGFFVAADFRRRRHRFKLWRKFFREQDDSVESWSNYREHCLARWRRPLAPEARLELVRKDARQLWEMSGQPTATAEAFERQAALELDQERNAFLVAGWLPPLVETTGTGQPEAAVNAAALFRRYLHLGRFKMRMGRALFCTVLYVCLLMVMVAALGNDFRNLLIRGHYSHRFDLGVIWFAGIAILFVVFYMFDAVFLSKRLLDYISRHPTRWPDAALRKRAELLGVKPGHLDGALDMEFAAVQTAEIGPLLFGPLILVSLLVIARAPWFDNWCWPPGLILMFAMNYLAVFFSWWMVRRTAENVRQDALRRLETIRLDVKNSGDAAWGPTPAAAAAGASLSKEAYLSNLAALRQTIEAERRGAFAQWFQDPTYLAVFVPSGISGVIGLISTYWLGK